MNTLNKKYTSTFFKGESGYYKLIERWSEIVNSDEGKNLSSTDFLYYAVLRGKDYKKAFLPGRKLQDYDYPEGLWNARCGLFSTTIFDQYFEDILDKNWKTKIRKLMPGLEQNIYELDSYFDAEVVKLLGTTESAVEQKLTVKVEPKKTIFQKIFHRS